MISDRENLLYSLKSPIRKGEQRENTDDFQRSQHGDQQGPGRLRKDLSDPDNESQNARCTTGDPRGGRRTSRMLDAGIPHPRRRTAARKALPPQQDRSVLHLERYAQETDHHRRGRQQPPPMGRPSGRHHDHHATAGRAYVLLRTWQHYDLLRDGTLRLYRHARSGTED